MLSNITPLIEGVCLLEAKFYILIFPPNPIPYFHKNASASRARKK
jgi:hypothetical protein